MEEQPEVANQEFTNQKLLTKSSQLDMTSNIFVQVWQVLSIIEFIIVPSFQLQM